MYKAFVFITVEIAPESEKKKIELHLIKSETKCIFQSEYSSHGFTHAFKHKTTQHRAKVF